MSGRWRGRAFGLELAGDFPAPGLERDNAAVAPPSTVLRTVSALELDGAWPAHEAQTVFDRSFAGARFAVHQHRERGFLVEHDYFGRFAVSADGSLVTCVPREMDDWLWQRLLVGQLLPLAALLRGLEPLHASAVALGGRALLCLGSSGAGKTSVALHLADTGATLLSDDVAATEARGPEVHAHPGAALTSVDPGELERLSPGGPVRAWPRLGSTAGEVRLLVQDLHPEAVPVGAVFLIVRRDDAAELSIEPLEPVLPVLLGATFNAYHRAPSRLAAHFRVCALLAETVPVRRVDVPPGVDAALVAEAIAGSFRAVGAR